MGRKLPRTELIVNHNRAHTRGTLRVEVGRRWIVEARRLRSAEARAIVGDDYDVAALRTPIDFVISERNLTADLPDEPVLPFILALCNAVVEVLGSSTKAIVAFGEAPIEVALEKRGRAVLLSVYELGLGGRFRIERHSMEPIELIAGVRFALDPVIEHAALLPSSSSVALRSAADALDRASEATVEHVVAVARSPPIVVRSRDSSGLEFTTRLDPESTDMASATSALPLDRHILLARGSTGLADGTGRTATIGGRPLRLLEGWVDAMSERYRRPADQLESPEVRDRTIGRVSLRVADGLARLVLSAESGDVEFEAAAEVLVGLLAEHVNAVVSAVLRLNPVLSANELLLEIARSSEALGVRARAEFAPRAVRATTRDSARPAALTSAPAGYRFPASAVVALRLERRWSAERSGLDARALMPVAGGWLLRCRESMVVVDAGSGLERWARPLASSAPVVLSAGCLITADGTDGVTATDSSSGAPMWKTSALSTPALQIAASSRAVVVATVDSGVACLSRATGGPLWETKLPGGPPQTVAASDRAAIVLHSDGTLQALACEDGVSLWQMPIARRRASIRVVGARVFIVADDPAAAAVVTVLDAVSGDVVWHREYAADLLALSWATSDGVAVTVADSSGVCLHVVDRGGDRTWSAPLPSVGPASRPQLSLDRNGVVVVAGHRITRVVPEGVVWRLPKDAGATGQRLNLALQGSPTDFVAVADDDEVIVIESTRGRVLHREPAFWERLAGFSVDARGNLALIETLTSDSVRVHGVPAVGVLAVMDGGGE